MSKRYERKISSIRPIYAAFILHNNRGREKAIVVLSLSITTTDFLLSCSQASHNVISMPVMGSFEDKPTGRYE